MFGWAVRWFDLSDKVKRPQFFTRVRLIGGWKISGEMKKWEDGKYLVFPCVWLVGGMKK